MKKSVNGKSFDEIFGQRGEEVAPSELKTSNIYLFDQEGVYTWNWLAVLSNHNTREYPFGFSISSKNEIIIGMGIDEDEVKTIYEATPDQIDLLNSYKNERP